MQIRKRLVLQVSVSMALIFALFVFQNGTCAQIQDASRSTQGQRQQSCGCPAGFTVAASGDVCERVESVFPVADANRPRVVRGDQGPEWAIGMGVVNPAASAPWSWGNGYAVHVLSSIVPQGATMMPVPVVNGVANFARPSSYDFLRSRVSNATPVSGGSPIAIKVQSWPAGWATNTAMKKVCVHVPATKEYLIHAGGADSWMIRPDGEAFAMGDSNAWLTNPAQNSRRSAVFIQKTLTAGKHVVDLVYNKYTPRNDGNPEGVWFEVLDNTVAELEAASQELHLRKIFSTGSMDPDDSWDAHHGDPVCPAGFTYDVCGIPRPCNRRETRACSAVLPTPVPSVSPAASASPAASPSATPKASPVPSVSPTPTPCSIQSFTVPSYATLVGGLKVPVSWTTNCKRVVLDIRSGSYALRQAGGAQGSWTFIAPGGVAPGAADSAVEVSLIATDGRTMVSETKSIPINDVPQPSSNQCAISSLTATPNPATASASLVKLEWNAPAGCVVYVQAWTPSTDGPVVRFIHKPLTYYYNPQDSVQVPVGVGTTFHIHATGGSGYYQVLNVRTLDVGYR